MTVSSAVHMHIPMDDNVERVLLGTQDGVPSPWVIAPLAAGMGDLCVPNVNGTLECVR